MAVRTSPRPATTTVTAPLSAPVLLLLLLLLAASAPLAAAALASRAIVPAVPLSVDNGLAQGSWQVDPAAAMVYFSSQFHVSVTTILLGQKDAAGAGGIGNSSEPQTQPQQQQQQQWVVVNGAPGSGVTGSGRINADPDAWAATPARTTTTTTTQLARRKAFCQYKHCGELFRNNPGEALVKRALGALICYIIYTPFCVQDGLRNLVGSADASSRDGFGRGKNQQQKPHARAVECQKAHGPKGFPRGEAEFEVIVDKKKPLLASELSTTSRTSGSPLWVWLRLAGGRLRWCRASGGYFPAVSNGRPTFENVGGNYDPTGEAIAGAAQVGGRTSILGGLERPECVTAAAVAAEAEKKRKDEGEEGGLNGSKEEEQQQQQHGRFSEDAASGRWSVNLDCEGDRVACYARAREDRGFTLLVFPKCKDGRAQFSRD